MGEQRAGSAHVYLDWNATTPPHPAVLARMAEALQFWANPSSVHTPGRAARALVEQARERLARELEVDARDVLFTSGGTEANNLALHRAPLLVTSRLEHPSVVRLAERLGEEGRARWLPVPADGQLRPEDLELALSDAPPGTWVSVAAANHETGVVQPVSEIARVAHAAGARLHVDAVQVLGTLSLQGCREADALTVCAHKIRGPKGIGALAWRRGAAPSPLLTGGAQERGLRPGSQDAALAAGFEAAVEQLDVARHRGLAGLRDEAERRLLPYAERNGLAAPRLPHVSNLSFRGWRSDELVAALDLGGVCVSAGSACSAGTLQPSAVIESMLGSERASRAVRISLGELTTAEELEFALNRFEELLATSAPPEPSSIG
jgi:cysteine desulfurase